jgi:hypothetical protein
MNKEKLERLSRLIIEAKRLSVELLLDQVKGDDELCTEQAQFVEWAYYRLADAQWMVGESVKLAQ